MDNKMRNLVLIHLESLNMLNYRMNSTYFPTLKELEGKAFFFDKYYSTATSTVMATTDLAYSGVLHDESCGGIIWNLEKQVYEASFIDRCKEAGYHTMVVQYPKDDTDDTLYTNLNHRYGRDTIVIEEETYSSFLNTIDAFTKNSYGFVLWTIPYTSNISYNRVEMTDDGILGVERWGKSFERMDCQVRDIIDVLEKNARINDTTIILYGDHGDDLFQHGYYCGLSHAIEPLETLIHTPLMVIDSRLNESRVTSLFDTTMVGELVEKLLSLPEKELSIDDLELPSPDYVMSRNLYAAQRIKVGSFEKGYSITDGEYLLVAGNRGMKCFNTVMDPSCCLNLLDFFKGPFNNLKVDYPLVCKLRYHFPSLFDKESLERIADKIVSMRRELMKYVTNMYKSGECLERIYEIDFESIYHGSSNGVIEVQEQIFEKYYKGRNVILYGAGKHGQYCYDLISSDCNIVAWVDRDHDRISNERKQEIKPPEMITSMEYDVVYIAIVDNRVRQSVKETLIEYGVPKEKII